MAAWQAVYGQSRREFVPLGDLQALLGSQEGPALVEGGQGPAVFEPLDGYGGVPVQHHAGGLGPLARAVASNEDDGGQAWRNWGEKWRNCTFFW